MIHEAAIGFSSADKRYVIAGRSELGQATAETGRPFRPMTAAPALMHKVMYCLVWHSNERMQPFRIDQHVADGEVLPMAGGLRAVHVPGHDVGQLAYLWRGNRLLIGDDVLMNIFGLAVPIGFEDEAEGRRSQRRLAAL